MTDYVPVDRARDVNHIEHLTVSLALTSLNPKTLERRVTITLEDTDGLWSLSDDLTGVRYKAACKNAGNKWAARGATCSKQDALGCLSQASSYAFVMDQLRCFMAH